MALTVPPGGDLLALYENALPSTRVGPLYNAFSYPTKISPEAIALFVATHTAPGDTVLDTFAGSGSTGIAALLCERPTPAMLDAAARLGLSPVWGARNAELYDISVIGTLAARVLTSPPEPARFRAEARALLDRAAAALPGVYDCVADDGTPGELRHVIFSEVLVCPACGETMPYGDARVRYAPVRFVALCTCSCGHTSDPESWQRATESFADPVTGTTGQRRVRVPWRVYGTSGKRKWQRPATDADAALCASVAARPLPGSAPVRPLRWGDLHRAGYHFGMTHLHHLYTPRNFLVMATLLAAIDEAPADLRDALTLLVLSFNATHSTLMTRVVLKRDQPDFVLTGAQSGVLYVSALPVEKNVLLGVARKIGVFEQAFSLLHGCIGRVRVHTASSTAIDLPEQSIAYLFTDPPFGGYIPYAEINQVNELWLAGVTDDSEEAVISTARGKTVDDYQRLLTSALAQAHRVLADDGVATLVFHSSKAQVWTALSDAVRAAGFDVTASSVLDKTQRSFKQVNGHESVSGDPLFLLHKAAGDAAAMPVDDGDLVSLVLATARATGDAAELNRERLYSRFVGASLRRGIPVSIGANEFYAAVQGMGVS
ncbi:MAG TPA: DNA methyltransferase [Pseudonocardiaceae bacterium]|nr:DNA methyltransferase [Pseudonocardiaceae bacterium]